MHQTSLCHKRPFTPFGKKIDPSDISKVSFLNVYFLFLLFSFCNPFHFFFFFSFLLPPHFPSCNREQRGAQLALYMSQARVQRSSNDSERGRWPSRADTHADTLMVTMDSQVNTQILTHGHNNARGLHDAGAATGKVHVCDNRKNWQENEQQRES